MEYYRDCKKCDASVIGTINSQGSWVCKACSRASAKASYKKHRKRRIADTVRAGRLDPEKKRLRQRAYYARNRELEKQRMRDRYQRDKPKFRARQAVSRAIKAGKLSRGPCVKCEATDKIQAHHPDYSKPLEVVWLCPKCHGLEHSRG